MVLGGPLEKSNPRCSSSSSSSRSHSTGVEYTLSRWLRAAWLNTLSLFRHNFPASTHLSLSFFSLSLSFALKHTQTFSLSLHPRLKSTSAVSVYRTIARARNLKGRTTSSSLARDHTSNARSRREFAAALSTLPETSTLIIIIIIIIIEQQSSSDFSSLIVILQSRTPQCDSEWFPSISFASVLCLHPPEVTQHFAIDTNIKVFGIFKQLSILFPIDKE